MIVLLPVCSKMEENKPAPGIDEARSTIMKEGIAPAPGAEEKRKERAGKAGDELKPLLVRPMKEAEERLLEYTIRLKYRNSNFHRARVEILALAGKYGFINAGSTDTADSSSVMTASLSIRAKKLYDFLQEADRIGELTGEQIWVNDHTEEMVQAARRAKREDLRIQRNLRAQGNIAPAARNWSAIEESLKRSEDEFDASEHKKWKVTDSVEWAKVTIEIEPVGAVRVPPYLRALYGAVNIVLYLLYIVIYMSPFIVLFGLLWWKRKSIFGRFRKKDRRQDPSIDG